jgi:hypothetical protein
VASTARLLDERSEPRDEVHYRARAFGPDNRPLNLLLVNISACGMMARCEADYPVGSSVRVHLPVVGLIHAEVRWCLGGRMGFQLDRMIGLGDYYALLAAMVRS